MGSAALLLRCGAPNDGLLQTSSSGNGFFSLRFARGRLCRTGRLPDLRGPLQLFDFLLTQLAHLARLDIQHQRSVADAANLLDVMADLLKHLADFTIAPLNENQLIPGILSLANQPYSCRSRQDAAFMRSRLAALDHHSGAQQIQIRLLRSSAHLDEIRLLDPGGDAGQGVRQLAVVGHQQQAFARIVQPSHRKNPLTTADELHHRGTLFRVAHRRHVTLWLVDDVVPEALGTLQQFAIDADVIARRVGLGTQLGYDFPVDLHASGEDNLLSLAARANSGRGDDLLQPLTGVIPVLILLLLCGHQSPSPGCPTVAVASPASTMLVGLTSASTATPGRSAYSLEPVSSLTPTAATAAASISESPGSEFDSADPLSSSSDSASPGANGSCSGASRISDSASSPAIFSNSSIDGSSFRSFSPNRSRNSFVVL